MHIMRFPIHGVGIFVLLLASVGGSSGDVNEVRKLPWVSTVNFGVSLKNVPDMLLNS